MNRPQSVHVGSQPIDDYADVAGDACIEKLHKLARPLTGKRVLFLNATFYGGGVAELLRSTLPMMRDLGIDVEWKVMFGERDFFDVTKALHNALQGGKFEITKNQWAAYLKVNRENAKGLDGDYDCIVVNDPQPAAIIKYMDSDARWIWRCHIDTSEPNQEAWKKLEPYVSKYDAHVFSMPEFVPEDISKDGLYIVPPAIDPLSPKNVDVPWRLAGSVLRWVGVDLSRPIVCQVSRFDPWKDPLGVIDAYRIAKDELPELQLALVGSMASDDPEGWDLYKKVTDYAEGDDDIYIFSNYVGVGNLEVNAFQRLSHVVIQKSIREGFGLVVSEALYKGTPVVAGDVGGIPSQLRDGTDGYLVSDSQECGKRVAELVKNPELANKLGAAGKENVKQNFLITRLLEDELKMISEVLKLTNRSKPR